jgi:hypothetical protein
MHLIADQTENIPRQLNKQHMAIKYMYIKNIPFNNVVQKVFLNLIDPCFIYEQFNVFDKSFVFSNI